MKKRKLPFNTFFTQCHFFTNAVFQFSQVKCKEIATKGEGQQSSAEQLKYSSER